MHPYPKPRKRKREEIDGPPIDGARVRRHVDDIGLHGGRISTWISPGGRCVSTATSIIAGGREPGRDRPERALHVVFRARGQGLD